MYTIQNGDEFIHNPRFAIDGRVSISPVLSRGVNRQGSLQFSLAVTNPMYDTIRPRLSYVSVRDDSGEIWRGRVISIDRGWNNVKSVYCEGELAYFRDSVRRPFVRKCTRKSLFEYLISQHNSQVDEARRFVYDATNTTIDDTTVRTFSTDEPYTIWELLEKFIFDSGYVVTSKSAGVVNVKCISDFPDTADTGQKIEFGKNLLDLSESTDASNVITYLIPYGGYLEEGQIGYQPDPPSSGTWNGNRLTIQSVNGGSDVISNPTGEAIWGKIVGTAVFDSITVNGTTQADLESAANTLLSRAIGNLAARIGKAVTIRVSAIDLSSVDATLPKLGCGIYVWVYSKLHDIKIKLLCKEETIYFTQPDKTKYTFGAGFKTLTDLNGATIVND